MKLLDSCFLLDLQRELRRGEKLGAEDYLKKHTREEFGISTVSITEFLEGFELSEDGEKFLRPFRWLSVNAAVAREASRISPAASIEGKPDWRFRHPDCRHRIDGRCQLGDAGSGPFSTNRRVARRDLWGR